MVEKVREFLFLKVLEDISKRYQSSVIIFKDGFENFFHLAKKNVFQDIIVARKILGVKKGLWEWKKDCG